ncbi:MAG: hypothetical protein H0X18_14500 [Geodermatophilaceae bacterium]|nr:hypothetical protein [Geodermatophilaceae bacterium]
MHEELLKAQAETLKRPRRSYGIAARVLFVLLDTLYGKPRTLSKFKGSCSAGAGVICGSGVAWLGVSA